MPPTYCPCPRPILKRRTPSPERPKASLESPRDESAHILDIDRSVLTTLVHFPPTTDLTRVHEAISASIYDRSPIVVTPNKCSLPERGCPGKTYVPGDETDKLGAALAFASRPRSGKKSSDQSPAGRHLHPRAVRVHLPRDEKDEDDDDELTPIATSVIFSHPLPPLIPDVSSSSDSEESDAFVSPPMDSTPMAYAPLYATSLPSMPAASSRTASKSIAIPSSDLSASFQSMYLSPATSPSSPMSFRSRIASYATRATSPARSLSPSRSTPRSHSPCRESSSPSRRRHSKSKYLRGCPSLSVSPASPSELEAHYKSISDRSLFSSSLDVPDDGCLGGF